MFRISPTFKPTRTAASSESIRVRMSKSEAWRFGLVALAIAAGGLAQMLIITGNPWWSIAPYSMAAIAIIFAVGGQQLSRFAYQSRSDTTRRERAWRLEQTFGAILAALSIALLAVSLRLFPDEPPYTVGWYSYGFSVVFLLFALPTIEGRWSLLARRLRIRPLSVFDIRTAVPWIILAAILILGLTIRLYNLDSLPAGFWYDEADNLRHADRIQNNPGSTPVFVPSTNLPSLFLMPIAFVVKVAGLSMTSARLVAVAFGVASIVAVFLLVRLMMGTHLGLVAAFLTAVMRWNINWSRIGMHGVTAIVFAALTAYLTLRALRSGRLSDYGFAGAMLGLGMWFYAPFRLFPLVVGVMLIHHFIFQRPDARRFLGQIAILIVTTLIVAAPVIQSAIVDYEDFFARTDTTSVFSDSSFGGAFKKVTSGLGKHALMFNVEGDPNPRHNLPDAPMLDGLSAVLMLIGLSIALARWRNLALIILPIWIVLMALPGVLTLPVEAPQSLRSIAVTPAVIALVTLAIGALWWAGRSAHWRNVRIATPFAIAAILGGIAFLNVNTYFGAQASNPEVYASFSTDETLVAQDIIEGRSRGYTFFASSQYLAGLTIGVLADNPNLNVTRAPASIPVSASSSPNGSSIFIERREQSFYELLRTYYPDAEFREVRPPGGGRVLYYQVVISREQLEDSQGLAARYTLADGTVISGKQLTTDGLRTPIEIGSTPFDILWEGALHIVRPGEYKLTLEGDVDAEVFLDGRRILGSDNPSVRFVPAEGLHALEVRGLAQNRNSVLRVLWQPPRGELEAIPVDNLYNGTIRPVGLAGRIFRGNSEDGFADVSQVMPALNDFYYASVLPEPSLSVWEGNIVAPEDGNYQFSIDAFGGLKLFLDGILLAQRQGENPASVDAEVFLTAGEHSIRVEYLSQEPPTQFQVLWSVDDSELHNIPLEYLTPSQERMFRIISTGS